MRITRHLVLTVSLIALAACSQTSQDDTGVTSTADTPVAADAPPVPAATNATAKRWLADVEAIAAPSDNAGRRRVI